MCRKVWKKLFSWLKKVKQLIVSFCFTSFYTWIQFFSLPSKEEEGEEEEEQEQKQEEGEEGGGEGEGGGEEEGEGKGKGEEEVVKQGLTSSVTSYIWSIGAIGAT